MLTNKISQIKIKKSFKLKISFNKKTTPKKNNVAENISHSKREYKLIFIWKLALMS